MNSYVNFVMMYIEILIQIMSELYLGENVVSNLAW